ncbi:HC-toxin synthetase [Fusarium odoratissimum]|uniref:HC-toxin synthetase n=1 Tax=Fusarium oxysporum f. sp. cubense (strain race 4) TaxID=2502994 RepID=N1SA95_FUSC4|nr:HC-toxin synthetase [Fusarium odoratissimum]
MAPTASCACLRTADQSMPDLEPTMFPQFDLAEVTRSEYLGYASQIDHVAPDDLSVTCTALWATWAILLGCFTGMDNVCFGFDSQHNVTETSGHAERMRQAVHVRLPTNQRVEEILTGRSSSLVLVRDDKAKTLFNTILSIQSLDHEPSNDVGDFPSWCKIHMTIDPMTLDTILTWNPSFMSRDQAENVSRTFEKIFREIINRPETLVSKINWSSERNERQVLAWNSNPIRDVHKCIHQAVSMQGALRPDAEAVCAWDGSLSYQQVLSLSDRLACHLKASGVGPEVFVPLCFDKSKWVVVSMLAVLKAGGIFVPLDPAQPLLRLQSLAQKVQAKTILCSPQHQCMLVSVAPELIPVDDQLFTELPENSDEVDFGSWRNGAYMIFTSGTTGEPKGALIEHGALMSSALAHGPAMMMDSNTRSFQFAASTFDVSITEILTCMILGGCVCIPSEDDRLNAVEGAITQLRANWALLTPTFVKFINPANVPTLKTLVTGGEAMTQAVIRSWSHINLINCYGPAETSVVSHVHRGMVQGTNPLNIGHQIGIHCWIVDRDNHDRLMPVGAVGELVIEGHTLAREYYKEPEKTREAFIEDPSWAKNQLSRTGSRRMYKTGDLVKYNHDGTFHIAGRKDAQIKFHGQRIELGEIEHHINASASIKHGIVVLPREGFCNGRLLAIVQLCDALNQDLVPNGQPYKLIDGELESTMQEKIAETKDLLSKRLPSYMIPSMWLAVEFIPRLQSGKLDRKQTAEWVDGMSEALYRQLNPVAAVVQLSEDLKCESKIELELHKIWTYVLNLKEEQLGLAQSFLSVGGDSISAMQVMSECKKRGLGLAVSHIINCKSISALALQVKDIERPALLHEIVETPFDLSPIQKLYFSRPNYDQGHYNQSFLLRTSQRIHESDLRKAMETLISRHSMLRARFQQDVSGEWQQRITNDVTSSYRLRALKLASQEDVDHLLVNSQTCLDPVHGPLVAADLIDRGAEEQLLFVVAHHLVIDLVSWRIILQELEEILLRPEAVRDTDRPLPFQVWCKMQSEHAQAQTLDQVLPIHGIPDGDAEYWGMTNVPNIYGQMARQGFEIGPCQTSLLVSKCHDALRTEIPDVLMAAMVYSFGQIFTDRPIPAVFAEGHGREVWDSSIDLSNVVGWFTTIYPVFAGSDSQSSLIDTVKMIKDARRKVPDNGRPYFASRWLTKEGREAFSRHWPLEITFNYLGQYQQLEREGALFTPESNIAGEIREASQGADVGPLTACISLFEVSAVIVKGSLRFSFGFNQNMKHQPQIRQWISCCEQSLGEVITSLASMAPEPTLSDFPLLSLTYDRLRVFTEEKLPEAGITDVDFIQDAYPCSPMQSGLLVSTTRENAAYAAYTFHEVKSKSGETVDVVKLITAWKRMVQYHTILRTIFLESVTLEDSIYDQVVLKEVQVPFTVSESGTDDEALAALKVPTNHGDNASRLLHHFHVCTAKSGKVFCRLDISHVIMDGTSLSILFRDLALAYQGSLKAETGPPYRDYIKALQSQPVQPGIDYWKSYLAGIEPCLFPVLDDGEIAEVKELRHLRVRFDEVAELQSLCERQGVTIVNAIYAAWAVTLRLYTGSDEVCFGYLTSARDLPIEGIRDTVGPIINMVTCRVNVDNTTNFGDIMSSVQRDYLDSLEYRHTPLAQVHHALQLSDAVLFNTALSYRKLPPTPQTDLVFEECCPTYDPDEYNVSVNVEAGERDMAIDLMYWSDTLSDGQASNVASTFTKALSNILHHCDQPLAQLDHLGSWHSKQICRWNQRIPEAIECCIHDLFKQQVASRPDSPAIVSWDMDFTYAELDSASDKLAHYVSSLGVGLETFVMVCFEKSAFAIVSMLAILKAGGVCVPLDPAHPDAALRLRAEDTGATIALVSPSVVSKLSSIANTMVAVDADLLQTISTVLEPPRPQVTPHNACFVIYTSGSTGRPKGVVLEHRGIASNAMYSGPKLGYGQDSRVLQFASYTFDNSLAEIFSTISLGGCVCVPSDHERLNDLAGAINRCRVTLADITPTVACFLKPSEVPTLKTLALGGEAVTVKCVGIWRDFVSLRCCYGPSECSVNSTYSGDIAQPGKASNIGRAIGSVAWVVDATDHNLLVPIGCVGELLIDGPIVSRGYLNLPEKMAQSFVPPPACIEGMTENAKLDRKLYKTGDLVRYNSDGTLTYLGRKDTQVKLNGQRIELGEIEHHIEENLPKGWESAVELITSQGRKLLACFICADADISLRETSDESMVLDMDHTFRSLAKELEIVLFNAVPAYMVPSAWHPVSKMPLTSSGKLNRRSLRVLGQSVPAAKMKLYKLVLKSGRAPFSEVERQLAAMWAQLLNIDVASIGVQDHFFKLGGDSIGAMQLVTLARCSNIDLTVAGVFQKPSLLDMAESAVPLSKAPTTTYRPFSLLSDECSVDALRQTVADSTRIEVGDVQDIYPCSALQEGLMALSTKEPGAYVAQLIYRLPADIDTIRFQKAWNIVVEAEPTLRTRIVHTEDSGFVQVVIAGDIPQWSTFASLSDADTTRRQLPLHNGARLTNYGLVDDGSTGKCFVWTIHHSIYDGWCLPLILDKVKRCYHDDLSSTQLKGPDYSNFIKYLTDLDPNQDTDFWKSYLSNMSAQHFPRLPNADYQCSATSLMIHKATLASTSGSEITAATRIRTAWAMAVSTYSGTSDVVFWETMTGRDAPVVGIEEMAGITLATVPTRVVTEPSKTVAELLASVQDRSAAVRRHQFAGIQSIRNISADTALACGAQNLLAINYGPRESTDAFWCEHSNEMAGTNFYSSYPLMLSCHFADGELETVVHFDQNVIPEPQMQRIMDHFALMLESVSSSELLDEKLGDIPLLSSNDYQTMQDMNRTPPPAFEGLIHDAIRYQTLAQVQDKLAVLSWDQNLTYADLDSQSTRLAGVMIENGVSVHSIVPFCMDKSSLVVVSILAILKSGAAFVPLDPAHPDARIESILADTGATVVLSSDQHAERLMKLGSQVISVSQALADDSALGKDDPAKRAAPSLSANSPAYIIFTSGTTGKPKGTIVDHSAFCTGAYAHGQAMGMTESSRVMQFASYTFDASIMEILTTLIHGGTVCVPSTEEQRLHDLAGAMNRMRVNWALLTPSVAQLLQPSHVPGLETLVLGGEAMSSVHISSWASSVRLMNAYGPSETAVVAAVNPSVTLDSSPSNIGHAVGGICWVTDAANHDRLMPVGAVGELVIEGAILAEGYLNDPARTAESFITNPKWCQQFPTAAAGIERKFYKTGDLVKLTEHGIEFHGRKDDQVKVNGQRIELSEIEHHLSADPAVESCLAAVPASGPFKARLVAILSPNSLAVIRGEMTGDEEMQIVHKYAPSLLVGIREGLARHLTSYMIPSLWIVVKHVPLLPSGKLDRRRAVRWVEDMTFEQYHLVLDAQEEASALDREPSEVEIKLRAAWSKALNLKVDMVPFKQSFIHLGGDSISAMKLMAICRSSNIAVTVSQIMRAKSIIDLASTVTNVEDVTYDEEQLEKPFELSPIQKVYFESIGLGSHHFNQSMTLATTRNITSQELSNALHCIVKMHSMMRARFSQVDGNWTQRVTSDIAGSYTLRSHGMVDEKRLLELVLESQTTLNIIDGPIFAADMFEMEGTGNQIVTFVAHHLIVDVVSWNIILQDLEGLLSASLHSPAKPFSFQTWSSKQHEEARKASLERSFHDIPVPLQDHRYWGMEGVPNLHGDSVTETMTMPTGTSSLLSGSSHNVVDVLLASLLASFRQTFPDRSSIPPIFNEGHGREPPDDIVDLSRTVGWFTTLCPVFVPEVIPAEHDILDVVCWIRDFRRKLPGNGRPYFAHSMLPDSKPQIEFPVEIAFNFLGHIQDFGTEDSVFKSVDGNMLNSLSSQSDIGANIPRLALIEISASFTNEGLTFDFSFNRHMHNQSSISRWTQSCRDYIHRAAQRLSQVTREPSPDLSLLPLAFKKESQVKQSLDEVGITLDNVEAVYPCSSGQQGILLSQIKDPGYYSYSITFSVTSIRPGDVIDVKRLSDAWKRVVHRHSTLRTAFMDSLLKEGAISQVVLRNHDINVCIIECPATEVDQRLSAHSPLGLPTNHPPHRLTIFNTAEDTVLCILEMSHAISDGTSMPILFRDLGLAYEGSLDTANLAVYRDYVSLQQSGGSQDAKYWKEYLDGAEPCCLPLLTDGATGPRTLRTLAQGISHAAEFQALCTERGITLSNLLQLAWALVLQAYTGLDDVCFGYLVADRDVPVSGIDEAIGVFITMLVCRVRLDPFASLGIVLQAIQEDLATAMNYKNISLTSFQHAVGISNEPLFNTAYSFQRRSVSKDMAAGAISFDVKDARDPSEYDMTVNVEVWDSNVELQLCYWQDKVSDAQAANIASTFDQVLSSMARCDTAIPVGQLNILSDHGRQQLMSWNNAEPEVLNECVHHVFEHNCQRLADHTPAIDAWDATFTYPELDAAASRFAQYLVFLGVGPEMYIPLCFEKSAWTVVAMMAVLKAGGAFVPLDPTHPPDRIRFLVRNVDAKLIVCSTSLKAKFDSLDLPAMPLGKETMSLLPPVLPDSPRITVRPDNAAYIIFTSGTTGVPKGTIIEHASFTTGGTAHTNAIMMTPTSPSGVLHFASYAFDIAMGETFAPLTIGACVCVPSEDMRMTDLAGSMNTLGVTWAFLTPSLANLQDPSKFKTLQTLICGGETLTTETISAWGDKVELMNGYGPAECTMFAAANSSVSTTKDPANIGHAMDGNHTWVVDPRDHNCLVPVGCVGELLISGPIVTRGYLNDRDRTAASFIEDPGWMYLFTSEPVRLYKTGDLVRYCPDGSLDYLGRKDHQVKLHGQRMELGEIEARLESDPRIRQVFVNLPQSGIFKGRLVAITSFQDPLPTESSLATSGFFPIPESAMDAARRQTRALQHDLAETLPPYMIPSVWLAVQAIPLLLSGKLDRASASSWLADADVDFCKITVDLDHGQDAVDAVMTPASQQLRRIWASVLNISETETPLNRSLISLGGDSIMAIQILTRCHDQSIALTMQDIMSAKGISELATVVAAKEHQVLGYYEEDDDQAFELSPIQRLFFNNSANTDRGDRLNQSQLLSISRPVDTSSLQNALDAIVERHPMLRARFNKSSDREWTQHIFSHVQGSYGFQHHEVAAEPDMIPTVAASQRSIDVSGPVFAVDLFILSDGSQILGEALIPFAIQPADLDFWGMSKTANVYGDTKQKSFVITETDVISSILGDSHRAFKTEPLDLFITAILKSFAQSFVERELPTLFNEGHGREPWDQTIDPSQTVGWFTSLCPVHVSRQSLDHGDDIDHVRRVKDVRRSVPSNGRPYFAHRYLTESGNDEPMEILLNYLGRTQQSGHGNSLLSTLDFPFTEQDTLAISDVAPETCRLALFEISISVLDEGIVFTLMYNQHMLRQDGIETWVSNCKEILINTTRKLAETPSAPTLSDFPLLPISYADLHEIITTHLPNAHVSFDMVEDIYPCSPMQTGILLSQLLDPSQYLFHVVLQVTLLDGSVVDTAKLVHACHKVIERHPALRTIFIDSLRQGGSFDQVVLRPSESRISTIKCREIDVMAELNCRSLGETNKRHDGPMLPYQITICETPQGKVFMKLELNHAVTDGASTSVLLRDISNAYTNSLPPTRAPSYKEYIKYISNQSTASSLDFWKGYLSGSQYTAFPTINPDLTAYRRLKSVAVHFDRFPELQSLGSKLGVTFSNIVMVAWALLLGAYTDRHDVCFGYLASGRDARIDGVEGIVGPLINMLVFRFQFTPETLLKTLFHSARHDYMASLPHQHFSLSRVSHALGQAKRGFFNTAVSIQNAGVSSVSEPNSLTYEAVEAYDPSEYAVTLNANTTRGDEGIVFRYWTNILSSSQAQDLAVNMSELLNDFIDHSESTLVRLRLLQSSPVARSTYTQSPEIDGSTSEHDDTNNQPKTHSSGISASSTLIDVGDAASMSSNMCNSFSRDRKHLHNKLSALWRDSLEYEGCAILPTDNFFESGGDSIIAMSMVGNARDLDLPLTVADIFKNPEFGSLLDCLNDKSYKDSDRASSYDHVDISTSKKENCNTSEQLYKPLCMLDTDDAEQFVRSHICPVVGVSRASIIDVLPTTDFQDQAIHGSLLKSRWQLNYFHLDSSGALDISLLRESITNVVAAYDILRTVFVYHQGRYLQVVLRQVQPTLIVEDVESIDKFTSELGLAHQHAVQHPQEPSLRFIVARHKSSERHRIFIRISHAQYDGLSFPTILQSLKASFEGEPIHPTPSYASYIQRVLGTNKQGCYAYWRALLKGSTPTNVIQRQHTSLQTNPTQVLRKIVSTPSLASVNITTSTVIKAAWASALARVTGKTDVVFGNIISGRNGSNVPGIESVVGPCLNVVPVRVRHQPSWTVLDLLRYIQSQQVDNMPYETLGFREIINKCTEWDDDGANGFPTVVQHQSMPRTESFAMGGNTYQVGVMGSQEDCADLSVVTTPQDVNSTEVCLVYNWDGAISKDFAEQMFDFLCDRISVFSKDPYALL